jgi:thiamine-phosphate diphosphorylase/hydroxyethylthiazole kinase
MASKSVDYSLYLVTDSTPAILGHRGILQVVEDALKGGVTIVQYRDKLSETALLVKVAKMLHTLTKKYNVPLLINDRIDVALAVGCEGVHIGQDDLGMLTAIVSARFLTIVRPAECKETAREGCDYWCNSFKCY